MTIITKRGDIPVYLQELDSDDRLNAVIAQLLKEPAGTSHVTTVHNNGQELTFRTDSVDINALLRTANGIPLRRVRVTEATVAV